MRMLCPDPCYKFSVLLPVLLWEDVLSVSILGFENQGDLGSAVAQWKSASLEIEGQRVPASPASLCCGLLARHIYPSLVLIQPRKTCPCLSERLLIGLKESNKQTRGILTISLLEGTYVIC